VYDAVAVAETAGVDPKPHRRVIVLVCVAYQEVSALPTSVSGDGSSETTNEVPFSPITQYVVSFGVV
jgi:hypothetical protein